MPRSDGRERDQLRSIRIEPECSRWAEGSALVELGQTRVQCTASIEAKVPEWLRGQGKGWVTAEYSMLPRATSTRSPREAVKGRQTGRTTEIQRFLGRALRAAIDREALGEHTLWVDCDVLQADGGTRCAAIAGGMVAVVLACRRLLDEGKLKTMPVKGLVAAVSVGRVAGEERLDLCYEEDSAAEVDLSVVWTAEGRLVEVHGGAEGEAFSEADLARLLALSKRGVARIFAAERHVLKGVLGD